MAKNDKPQRNYEDVSYDIEAWWNSEKGDVLEGKLVDFRDVETKFGAKILYIVVTSEACRAVESGNDDAEAEEWDAGSNIGFLSSGGLNALKKLRRGAQVRIEHTGERDVGRGNPMKTYRVQVDRSEPGKGLSYLDEEKRTNAQQAMPQEQFKSEDDIPF
jgi:hypothetical protein